MFIRNSAIFLQYFALKFQCLSKVIFFLDETYQASRDVQSIKTKTKTPENNNNNNIKSKKKKKKAENKEPFLFKKVKRKSIFSLFGVKFINIGLNFGILWVSYLLSCKISHTM